MNGQESMGEIDQTLEDVKKQVLEVMFRYLRKTDSVIFLFGSLAQGEKYRSSDIDIGFFCEQRIASEDLALIRGAVEEEVKTLRDIDVIDFSKMDDKEFLEIALKRIQIWHQAGKSKESFHNLRKRISV